jgi:hypothetical protein
VTGPTEPSEALPTPAEDFPLDEGALRRQAEDRRRQTLKPDTSRDDLRRAVLVRPMLEREGWRPEHGGQAGAELLKRKVTEQQEATLDPVLKERRAAHRARLAKERQEQTDLNLSQNLDGLELL